MPLVQVQLTLTIDGDEATARRAVNKALDDGVFQNAIVEHDLEDAPPLRLESIDVLSIPKDTWLINSRPTLTRRGREALAQLLRIDNHRFARQLAYATELADEAPAGSQYLYALACAYLASPEAGEQPFIELGTGGPVSAEWLLEKVFAHQATVEQVDPDPIVEKLSAVAALEVS